MCIYIYIYRYLNLDMFVFIFIFCWTSYHKQKSVLSSHHENRLQHGFRQRTKNIITFLQPSPASAPSGKKRRRQDRYQKKQYMRAALSERRSRKQSQQCHHNNRIGLTIWRTICVFPSYRGWIIESWCSVITMTAGLQWIKRSTD